MFNLSGSEIVVILLLALVVLGPEKLPEALRRAGRTYAELKKLGAGFQDEVRGAFEEPVKEMRETADLLRKAATFDAPSASNADDDENDDDDDDDDDDEDDADDETVDRPGAAPAASIDKPTLLLSDADAVAPTVSATTNDRGETSAATPVSDADAGAPTIAETSVATPISDDADAVAPTAHVMATIDATTNDHGDPVANEAATIAPVGVEPGPASAPTSAEPNGDEPADTTAPVATPGVTDGEPRSDTVGPAGAGEPDESPHV